MDQHYLGSRQHRSFANPTQSSHSAHSVNLSPRSNGAIQLSFKEHQDRRPNSPDKLSASSSYTNKERAKLVRKRSNPMERRSSIHESRMDLVSNRSKGRKQSVMTNDDSDGKDVLEIQDSNDTSV